MRTCYDRDEVGHIRNKCPKLYDKTSQVGQFAHMAYASEGHVASDSRSVLMSNEEFKKYQTFQQFQATQITLFSSTATLAQSGNPTAFQSS